MDPTCQARPQCTSELLTLQDLGEKLLAELRKQWARQFSPKSPRSLSNTRLRSSHPLRRSFGEIEVRGGCLSLRQLKFNLNLPRLLKMASLAVNVSLAERNGDVWHSLPTVEFA